jgi:hypothetical protein
MRPSDMYRRSMSDMSALATRRDRRPLALERLRKLFKTLA